MNALQQHLVIVVLPVAVVVLLSIVILLVRRAGRSPDMSEAQRFAAARAATSPPESGIGETGK